MWAALLLAMEAEQTGPDDEFDDETNGDPDSQLGEDAEGGFDEMPAELGWPDETLDDDGFEGADESEDDEGEDDDTDDGDRDDEG